MTMPLRKWHLLAFALILALSGELASAQSNRGQIQLPEEARAFEIGGQLTLNGLPVEAQGFVSAKRPAQLAAWFRQSLGKPLVEDKLGDKLILGRSQGEQYLTVQLEPAGAGTRGIVAIADLKLAYQRRAETDGLLEHWRSKLPSGSHSIRRATSEDEGKQSEFLLAINNHGIALNLERIKSLMRADGYLLLRQATLDAKPPSRSDIAQNEGEILLFNGDGREATVLIFRNEGLGTAVVLNAVTSMARFK